MNYIELVVLGKYNDNPLQYFKSQFLRAKSKGIDTIDFYTNCDEVVQLFDADIDIQYQAMKDQKKDELKEFEESLIIANQADKGSFSDEQRHKYIKESLTEIDSIDRSDFSFQISKYLKTNDKQKTYYFKHFDLSYDSIQLLRKHLDEAYKQTLRIDELKSNGVSKLKQKVVKKCIEKDSKNRIFTQNNLAFLAKDDLRKNVQILDEHDLSRLISWLSYYFDNNFSLPDISDPIKKVNTSKRNIIYTFVQLFKYLHPAKKMPDSLFELLKKCFHQFHKDKISSLRKSTSKPDHYDKLIEL